MTYGVASDLLGHLSQTCTDICNGKWRYNSTINDRNNSTYNSRILRDGEPVAGPLTPIRRLNSYRQSPTYPANCISGNVLFTIIHKSNDKVVSV